MRLATLEFEPKLQKCIRMGITIFIIFTLGIYVRKSHFTAPLAHQRKRISDNIPPQMKNLNTVIPFINTVYSKRVLDFNTTSQLGKKGFNLPEVNADAAMKTFA